MRAFTPGSRSRKEVQGPEFQQGPVLQDYNAKIFESLLISIRGN
jgi:hypothetical protein